MPNWLFKWAIHRTIAWLPQRQRWNALFQKYGTRSLTLGPGMFELRVQQCHQHLEGFLRFHPEGISGLNVLELGTGWFPTLALGMHLCGAGKVWTFEIDPLLNAARLGVLVDYFCDYDKKGSLARLLPALKPDRIGRLHKLRSSVTTQDPTEFLKQLDIYFAVRDAQDTGLPGGLVDFVFSHGVLEYIPRPVLVGMFREFARAAAPGAVMNHYIDLADQYHYFDRRISPLHFLKYPEARWRWLDSPLMPQNRLRTSDYGAIHAETGWDLVEVANTPAGEKDIPENLAPEFRHRDKDDLRVIKSWMLSRRGA